jgi:polyisoprenoid-binding protein YceI
MRNVVFALAALLIAAPASATSWQVDPAASQLKFEADQAGELFSGSFAKFTSRIDLDLDAPGKGHIEVTVDMTSATVEGKDRQDSLPTRDWFATKEHPTASFISKTIRALGSDKPGIQHYEALGTLTIKGIAKEITLPFSVQRTGNNAVARGEITLNRKDFGIGTGKEWDSDQWIKFPVKVSFTLHATPK